MKLTKKTIKAIKSASVLKVKVKAKAIKASAIVSHQWKLVKQAGADRQLGHGGFYCLRASDVTENIVGATVAGAAKRLVCIFSGVRGQCFADGAFAGKVLNVAGIGIDTAKIKRINYFGSLAGAIDYVRTKGAKGVGATSAGESFTHYIDSDGHYGIATDGKRLLRLEADACSGNAKKFTWALGK